MPTGHHSDDNSTPARRGPWVLAIVASLTGLVLSILLAKVHYQANTGGDVQSFCNLGEHLNCDSVARSAYALFAGIPTSSWGMWGYTIALALSLWGWRRPRRPEPAGIVLWVATAFVASSIQLAYVSLTKINTLCILCIGTYVANIGFLAAAVWAARPLRAAIAAPVRYLRTSTPSALTLLATVAMSALVLWTAHPVYWKDAPKKPNVVHKRNLPHGIEPGGGHYIGSPTPALVIVEFSDYECPYCQTAHHQIRDLLDRYPDKLRVVHRHFPLDQKCNPSLTNPMHQYACHAAYVAECAGRQNKFWEANDYLFENAKVLESKTLADMATGIGLDLEKLTACVSEEGPRAVELDVKAGIELNLRGTPTFLIEGKTYWGNLPPIVHERVGR